MTASQNQEHNLKSMSLTLDNTNVPITSVPVKSVHLNDDTRTFNKKNDLEYSEARR